MSFVGLHVSAKIHGSKIPTQTNPKMNAPLRNRLPRLISSPLEPVLHLSRARLVSIGLFLGIGHILFGLLWTYVYPQHYENMGARLMAALLAAPLLFLSQATIKEDPRWSWYCVAVALINGPAILIWLYLMNPESAMWMATTGLSLVFLYQIIDWRLATAGLAAMAAVIGTLYGLMNILDFPLPDPTPEGWIVLGFAWSGGLAAGLSTANEHIHRLRSTLSSVGVMAHELRTPLASASLLSESLRSGADPARTSIQLDAVIRGMNHQIDSQIVNAQLIELQPGKDLIGARALVQNAIDTYPFKREADRSAVILDVQSDFVFKGNTRLFTQTIQNLMKNALQAIMKSTGPMKQGDIRIEILAHAKDGLIRVKDKGTGINPAVLRSIFEPFYSTQGNYSSGLGLAFCRQVVEINHGRIWVESTSRSEGTTFTIKMPQTFHSVEIVASRPASLAN